MTQIIRLSGDFQVPDDLVLINREQLEKLKQQLIDEPILGDKKWLKRKLGVLSDEKLWEILDTYHDELDMLKGGMIHFPLKQGDPMKVVKKAFVDWLDENAVRIYGGE